MSNRLSEPPFPPPGNRVVVVGTTGSGKTTVAGWLADYLDVPHIELDALHWGPNWSKPKLEVFRQRVEQALACPAWVVDGNYKIVRDMTWCSANTLVWLDYDLPVILWQLTKRTLRRIVQREVLWDTNRETWRDAFFSKESLFLYAITSQKNQRKSYPQLLRGSNFSHLQVIHLRSPLETNRWVERLSKEAQSN